MNHEAMGGTTQDVIGEHISLHPGNSGPTSLPTPFSFPSNTHTQSTIIIPRVHERRALINTLSCKTSTFANIQFTVLWRPCNTSRNQCNELIEAHPYNKGL